ncbi:hypothetical protein JHK84_037450 [Glycine max]|nr:hypothetical protein JHK84_037450 [Glycine max]
MLCSWFSICFSCGSVWVASCLIVLVRMQVIKAKKTRLGRAQKTNICSLFYCIGTLVVLTGDYLLYARPLDCALLLSNYCSFEGVLYCKPHFDQLFKKTGSLDKSFEGIPRTATLERSTDQVQTNSKVSNLFAGTQEKSVACKKTVYPIEKRSKLHIEDVRTPGACLDEGFGREREGKTSG